MKQSLGNILVIYPIVNGISAPTFTHVVIYIIHFNICTYMFKNIVICSLLFRPFFRQNV